MCADTVVSRVLAKRIHGSAAMDFIPSKPIDTGERNSSEVEALRSSASESAPLMGEDSFRRVVEWAPNAMVMADAEGRIVLVNAEMERLFGYRRSELVGRSVDQLVPDRLSGNHASLRSGFFDSPAPRPMGSGRDLFARHADGSEFPVEIGLNPIDTENGVMVLASIVDITERKRAQQRIEKALQEKTVLLNELHHRVKNNLQMISSLLNLQAGNVDDPRLRTVLDECQSRVKAMGLTHQLLYEHKDFSRVDVGEYLSRLAQLLLSAYRARGGRITMRLTLAPERYYIGLEQAIPCGLAVNELITNAFKHAFPDERNGEITIGLVAAEEDGKVLLTVADNGVGLPPDFNLGAAKSLGLRLLPLLADQMRGSVTIDSSNGSRFELRFPADTLPGEKKT
ncbi:MAG TPA: histidine kinase dimerization/phosphoacceptor domain -containing protein [Rhodocyclaceae bacterium]|nr:histidine kinase dimerization/phosphoacceptor domain -containing protein [Rhodocyclaceae bacterium]